MITVTDSAKKQAIRLMEDEGQDGYFIRVGVEGGGCSGLMYQLEFDNKETENDKSFENNGIKVVVDPNNQTVSAADARLACSFSITHVGFFMM